MAESTITHGPFCPGPELAAWLAGGRDLLIDGAQVPSADGATFTTSDPATGRPLATVARAGSEDVDRAVRAAGAAFERWSRSPGNERERLLLRLADLVERDLEPLAELESLDTGKPFAAARDGDLPLVVELLRYFGGWATKLEGETLPTSDGEDMLVYTRPEPVGVVAAIVPWNFPLSQACFKLAPALAAGCTVVLKPAEQTPLTALWLADLILEAGFPPGVANVLTGFGEDAGAALVAHPGVRKVAFTGSVDVAREIARSCAADLKPASLELGGKSPNIVLADADVARAGRAAAEAIFYNAGQVCSAGSRLFVQREVFDELLEVVVAEARAMRLGHGLDATTTMGPLVSEAQRERVDGWVRRGVEQGATIATGGAQPGGALADGSFFEPTVLVDVADDHAVAREEIFGPVVVAQPFDDLDEVARRANAGDFGLAAGVWTNDLRSAHRLAAGLHTGTVWINSWNRWAAGVPWGGLKLSGYGRDNGRAGLEEYLERKVVWTSLV
ncbi:MAG: aldehyde dehydrogenase family protein [Patulibacter sp.]|nr:aldehyde dehydrogenase family protein [Patulibacter sp.]